MASFADVHELAVAAFLEASVEADPEAYLELAERTPLIEDVSGWSEPGRRVSDAIAALARYQEPDVLLGGPVVEEDEYLSPAQRQLLVRAGEVLHRRYQVVQDRRLP